MTGTPPSANVSVGLPKVNDASGPPGLDLDLMQKAQMPELQCIGFRVPSVDYPGWALETDLAGDGEA
jgi:hypothetical protein